MQSPSGQEAWLQPATGETEQHSMPLPPPPTAVPSAAMPGIPAMGGSVPPMHQPPMQPAPPMAAPPQMQYPQAPMPPQGSPIPPQGAPPTAPAPQFAPAPPQGQVPPPVPTAPGVPVATHPMSPPAPGSGTGQPPAGPPPASPPLVQFPPGLPPSAVDGSEPALPIQHSSASATLERDAPVTGQAADLRPTTAPDPNALAQGSAPFTEDIPVMRAPATAPTAVPAVTPAAIDRQLRGVTAMQLHGKRLRIGEVLIDMGLIDQGQLEHALSVQKETGLRLGKVLIQEGLASATDIARALARRLSIEYVDLSEVVIDDETLKIIPYDLCIRYDIVPVQQQGNALIVAMADPTNVFALDDIRLVTGKDIRVVVASPEAIDFTMSKLISLDDQVASAVAQADDWEEDRVPLEDIKDSDSDAPAIRLVNQIIQQAVSIGASDMHFEPQAEDMVVRFRKDGVLVQVTTVQSKLKPGVTSRLKIMANLDISERRRPQDGRVGVLLGEKPIDLRVAILPTVFGEKCVLRILDRSNVLMTMEKLGFLPNQLEKLRSVYQQPYGCVLVTGPTGSGKSTTLYAALNEVNDISKNIITVEDPVEYRLNGINQVQVNPKAGLTFQSALRSILRCDPDIVMIGEMRDVETAKIGIEAAMTGHLVLSTLHTNTAPGALTRLVEMGVEPFLVTSSVMGVLAQRLARRLCKCKEEFVPTAEYLAEAGFPQEVIDSPPPVLFRPGSCVRCDGDGYRGRLGIHEVMLMTPEIEQLTLRKASIDEIARVAIEQGMTTLFMDGVQKILRGDTTIDELKRIVQT